MPTNELDRVRAQRDRAWRCLQQIEEALGKCDEVGLAFILADACGPDDCEEWIAVEKARLEE